MAKNEEQNPFAVLKLDAQKVAKWNTDTLIREVDKRVRKVMAMVDEADSEVVRKAAQEALNEYTETQMALFASKGLTATRALNEAMVATGERNGLTLYRIVKRNEPLLVKLEDDGSKRSVAASKSYSSRMGYAREERRGKYNDAGLLIEQTASSVDASEVVPFISACV